MNQTPADKPVRRAGKRTYRLSANSILELRRAMDAFADHFKYDLEKQWEGATRASKRRTLMTAHLLNALFTWFLGHTPEEQDQILLDGLEMYIRRLDADPEADFESPPKRTRTMRGSQQAPGGNPRNTPNPQRNHVGAKR